MKTIKIIVPCYNEEKNLAPFVAEAAQQLSKVEGYIFDFLFVNDGSRDNTLGKLKELNLNFLDFSRNFGKEAATSAGINASLDADAVIMIDADLQHPIEKIPEFIKKWEQGAEVVVGLRLKNEKAGFIKNFGSKIFYKLMDAMGETEITPNATDFRLLDKKVVREFAKLTEHNRITRGLVDWMGFKRDYIEFYANERFAGEASYTFKKLLKLAITSFINHSLVPLKLGGYIGVTTTLLSGLLGMFIIIEKYMLKDPLGFGISPITQLAVLTVFLIGILLSCIGLIAMYIGLISEDTKGRPLYIIRETKN